MWTFLTDLLHRWCRPWLPALVGLCLASCGGGGGGGSPPAPGFTTSSANLPAAAVVKQGRFIDSPVIGVYYETATHKGFTGMSGEFSYVDGESVTFSIGKVVFPTVPASALVTPLTLAGADLSDPKVANMAYFLQSLDVDGNTANGLLIDKRLLGKEYDPIGLKWNDVTPADVVYTDVNGVQQTIKLSDATINFNQDTGDFVADPMVKKFILANQQLTGVQVAITPDAAVEDLAKNLLAEVDKAVPKLGSFDADTKPSTTCASLNATMSGSRTALPGNLWADVYAKPNNKFGWFYDSTFANRAATPWATLPCPKPRPASPNTSPPV